MILRSTNDIYFHYINTKVSSDLNILSFGYEKCAKTKEPVGPLSKSNFMMHYIIDGKGYFFSGGRKYILGRGDVFYSPPGQEVHYVQDYVMPWEYIWFEFTGSISMSLCKNAGLTSDEPTYHTTNPSIEQNLHDMLVIPSNKNALEFHAMSHLYKFFSQLTEERSSEEGDLQSGKQLQISKAIRFIDDHFADPDLSLDMVAEHLYLNPSYLSRIFKEVTGSTLIGYLITIRIKKASEYLEQNRFSVKDVASKVGYSNPYFFSREFKKHRGVSPIHYQSEGVYKEENES